eukprot:5806017-Pyramimonas_sp.AAC.2
MMDFLVKNGANKKLGRVIVPEHIPKVREFYLEDDGTHPKPSQEWLGWRKEMDDAYEAEKKKLIPGM